MADKPFPCPNEGCPMTFTNEDHLNVHRKKHDMVLNLGLITKNNAVADQTPTPTRFIRNCEELGLFQDLQNVNPFEETFKKALELSKSGTSPVIQASSDDTLHTPHILPHITVNPVIKEQVDSELEEPVFTISDEESGSTEDGQLVPSVEKIDKAEEESDLKGKPSFIHKIKMTVHSRPMADSIIKQIEMNCRKAKERKLPRRPIDIQRKRESNRMAQYRSRMRKKQTTEKSDQRMMDIEEDNLRLQLENQQLRLELHRAHAFMVKHAQCMFDGEQPPVARFIAALQPRKDRKKRNGQRMIMPKVEAYPVHAVFLQPVPLHQVQELQKLPGQNLTPPPLRHKSESMKVESPRQNFKVLPSLLKMEES